MILLPRAQARTRHGVVRRGGSPEQAAAQRTRAGWERLQRRRFALVGAIRRLFDPGEFPGARYTILLPPLRHMSDFVPDVIVPDVTHALR
jgi:hypothetical protein